jgi:hypothetical protein
MLATWVEAPQLKSAKGRLVLALAVYLATTLVYFASASRETVTQHTPYNHFALLARAWLDGHLDLGGAPPSYAGGNDFASFEGRWYVAFPPLPALLILPWVWLAGSPERVFDGQFFLWFAGLAPAALFLALEKLRRRGASERGPVENLGLSLLFAFGSVYFFSALQGTVWFAAHVVGTTLAALFLWSAIGADKPLLAGLFLGLGFATRTPLLFMFPLFLAEAWSVSTRENPESESANRQAFWARLDFLAFARRCGWFALPIAIVVGCMLWHNHARFDDPFESGYRFLTVRWQARIEKWGLFSYHYLGRNLGTVLTSLPWYNPPGSELPRFQVIGHGLALWLTTPAYLWLLWPRRMGRAGWVLLVTAAAVALPDLLYQNTGWVQFGYRFSNDFAPFLFALLAVGARGLGRGFALAAVWAIAINTFGALTFEREHGRRYYVIEGSQRTLYQPD